MRTAKAKGGPVVAISNVVGSALAREAHGVVTSTQGHRARRVDQGIGGMRVLGVQMPGPLLRRWLRRIVRLVGCPAHGTRAASWSTRGITILMAPHRTPTSLVERRVAEILEGERPRTVGILAQLVTHELYLEELRNGGWAVDIGFYGPKLFLGEVARTIDGADGVLWRIDAPSS